MVNKKYNEPLARCEHKYPESLHRELMRKLFKTPNGVTRTDYINASIMLMNSLELKEAKKHIVKYKKSLR